MSFFRKKLSDTSGYDGYSAASKAKRTRIICTLGPSSWSVDMLGVLLDEGMNVARLNFSHGDHEAHAGTLARLKQALAKRPGVHCAVMLDTKGPEIRTGFFAKSVGDKLKLKKGSTLILTTDYDHKSDGTKLGCTYKKLPTSVKPGAQILCADGSLVLEVVKALNDTEVSCKVCNDCAIGERKNMNLPGVVVDLPVLQAKDTKDLEQFACKYAVDFVAASFVQTAADVKTIRKVLDNAGGKGIKIISKIENQEGLDNFAAICKETDAVMVARGDLGMEIPPEQVFRAQKMMISTCNASGTPVIVATQMLESMTTNPRPTRAECSDVANAVLDGADAVMLSGETAGGMFPREAVAIMARTCCEAEREIDYVGAYVKELATARGLTTGFGVVEATVAAGVQAVRDAGAKAVIVLAKTGSTAQLFAKYKCSVPVIVVTSDAAVARYAQALIPGAKPLCLPGCTKYGYANESGADETKMVAEGTKLAKALGLVAESDYLLALHSYRVAGEKNIAMRFFHASSVL